MITELTDEQKRVTLDGGEKTRTGNDGNLYYPRFNEQDLKTEHEDLQKDLLALEKSLGEIDIEKEKQDLASLEKTKTDLDFQLVTLTDSINAIEKDDKADKAPLTKLNKDRYEIGRQRDEVKKKIDEINIFESQIKLAKLEDDKKNKILRQERVNFALKNSTVLRPKTIDKEDLVSLFDPKESKEEAKKVEQSIQDSITSYKDGSRGGREKVFDRYNNSTSENDKNIARAMFTQDQEIEAVAEDKQWKINKGISDVKTTLEEEARIQAEKTAEENTKRLKSATSAFNNEMNRAVGVEIVPPTVPTKSNETKNFLDTKRAKDFVNKLFDGISPSTKKRFWIYAISGLLGLGAAMALKTPKEAPPTPPKQEKTVEKPKPAILPSVKDELGASKSSEAKPNPEENKPSVKDAGPKQDLGVDKPLEAKEKKPETKPPTEETIDKRTGFLIYNDETNHTLNLLSKKLESRIKDKSTEEYRDRIASLDTDEKIREYLDRFLSIKGHSRLDDDGYRLFSGNSSNNDNRFTIFSLVNEDVHLPIKINRGEAIDAGEFRKMAEDLIVLAIRYNLDPKTYSDKNLKERFPVELIKKISSDLRK